VDEFAGFENHSIGFTMFCIVNRGNHSADRRRVAVGFNGFASNLRDDVQFVDRTCVDALGAGIAVGRLRRVYASNVDDHLRNHGLLWTGSKGWSLSPTYDLNPTAQLMHQ
jgi:HipA-like C-terminal domain